MSESEIEVADSTAIGEGDVIAFDVDGRDIAVARSGAKLYAFDDCCTHEECPLSTGWLEGTEIECDRHGARFDLETGAVTLPPAFAPLQTHRVSERDGRVFVTLASTPATAE